MGWSRWVEVEKDTNAWDALCLNWNILGWVEMG